MYAQLYPFYTGMCKGESEAQAWAPSGHAPVRSTSQWADPGWREQLRSSPRKAWREREAHVSLCLTGCSVKQWHITNISPGLEWAAAKQAAPAVQKGFPVAHMATTG